MISDRAAWTRSLSVLPCGKSDRAARAALGDVIRANKYHARKCTVNGIRFDSMREAKRYQELLLLEQAGEIHSLTLQPEYKIWVTNRWTNEFVEIGRYRVDFWYIDCATEATVIENAKSPATRTTAYRLRKRLVEAIHGITITEV